LLITISNSCEDPDCIPTIFPNPRICVDDPFTLYVLKSEVLTEDLMPNVQEREELFVVPRVASLLSLYVATLFISILSGTAF